jgi:hypothetical protein
VARQIAETVRAPSARAASIARSLTTPHWQTIMRGGSLPDDLLRVALLRLA